MTTDETEPEYTVLLCLSNDENRRLLAEWISEQEGLVPAIADSEEGLSSEFDVCLLDGPALKEFGGALGARRRLEPTYLPCLLVVPEWMADADEALVKLPSELAEAVDDTIATPIRKRVLEQRLHSLLRAREYSTRLARSRNRYHRILEFVPEPVFVCRDGEVDFANEAALDLLGQEETEILGRALVDFVTDEERQRVARYVHDVGCGRSAEFVNADVERADGERVPAEFRAVRLFEEDGDASGDDESVAVPVIVRDRSRLVACESERETYERALDEAPVGVTISDPNRPENPFVYANERFAELTGWPREAVVGRSANFDRGTYLDEEARGAVRDAVETGRPTEVELLDERADGTPWVNSLSLAPVRDERGEVVRLLGYQRDVTDEYLRTEHVGALDEAIRRDVDERRRTIVDEAAALAAADDETVRAGAKRAERAARDLPDASDPVWAFREGFRTGGAERRLDELLREAVDGCAGREPEVDVETAVELDFDLPDPAPEVDARLAVAVRELVSNGLRYGESPSVRVSATAADGRLVVRVADDGPGIPEDRRAPFDADCTAPDGPEAIGLWLVRWTVDQLGGDVTYGESNGGGEVALTLPHRVEGQRAY